LKVLHINWRDSGGGAFTACERLHGELLKQGVDSWILCDVPSGTIPNVIGLRKASSRGSLPQRIRARARFELNRITRAPFFTDPSCHNTLSLNYLPNRILQKIDDINPDLVHLHWIGHQFVRIEDIPVIATKFTLVWTLHDMWPFCGAEHVAFDDTRWKNGYTKMNRSHGAKGPDLTRWVYERKLKAWSGSTIHTIAVSNWINDCITTSKLFQNIQGKREVIHNGLDTSIFKPNQEIINDKYQTRGKRPWRLLFGATSLTNPIKGGDLLLEALDLLYKQGFPFELHTFGNNTLPPQPYPIVAHGQITSQAALAELYNQADVMLVPSRLESFGQVAAEATACGTPFVSFRTSGLIDIHKSAPVSYLAECFNPADFAEGIRFCIQKASISDLPGNTEYSAFDIKRIAAITYSFYNLISS
jgi:glycosyltransferase involved in cell wall biosynthesis